jgi:hypothetical protein
MPPKGQKKMSTEAQISALKIKAQKLSTKRDVEWVTTICRQRPELVADVIAHLGALGFKRPADDSITEIGDAASAATLPRRGSSGSVCTSVSPEARLSDDVQQDVVEDDDTAALDDRKQVLDPIPRKYQTWGSLPAHYLVELLAVCEPVACSLRALAAFTKGRKSYDKDEVQRTFTFMLGVEMAEKITPARRPLTETKRWLSERNREKGRRLRDLCVPLNWSQQGLFKVELCSDGVWVKHISGKRALLPGLGASDMPESIIVENNWSEEQAVVTQEGTSYRMVCQTILAAASGRVLPKEELEHGAAVQQQVLNPEPQDILPVAVVMQALAGAQAGEACDTPVAKKPKLRRCHSDDNMEKQATVKEEIGQEAAYDESLAQPPAPPGGGEGETQDALDDVQ